MRPTELDARIARLRERLKNGDPDLTSEELQAAIERAESKRRELKHARNGIGTARKSSRFCRGRPEYYGQQISLGLDGDPAAARKRARSCANCSAEKWLSYPARAGACGPSTDCTWQPCCKVQEQVVGVTGFEPATYTSRRISSRSTQAADAARECA